MTNPAPGGHSGAGLVQNDLAFGTGQFLADAAPKIQAYPSDVRRRWRWRRHKGVAPSELSVIVIVGGRL